MAISEWEEGLDIGKRKSATFEGGGNVSTYDKAYIPRKFPSFVRSDNLINLSEEVKCIEAYYIIYMNIKLLNEKNSMF